MIGELRRRGADAVVCAMSGQFVQRGDVAVAGKAARAEMAQVRRDFAAKMTCPVYEGYPYGHVPKSFAIDFLREKTITVDGVLKQ